MQKLRNRDIESILDNTAHRDMLIDCLSKLFRQSTWETDGFINEYLYCDRIIRHPELILIHRDAVMEVCSFCESFERELECLQIWIN